MPPQFMLNHRAIHQAAPGTCEPCDEVLASLPDPPWLARMRLDQDRACDECGAPDGRYTEGGPGMFTCCRRCTIAGCCMECGGPADTAGRCIDQCELALR